MRIRPGQDATALTAAQLRTVIESLVQAGHLHLRSDRVFHAPAGQRQGPTKGRPPRHGPNWS